jgi:uncharacterized OB-fold protein
MTPRNNQVTSDKEPIFIAEGLVALPSSPTEKPYLIGSKCGSCGETFFPSRLCCRRCSSEDMEKILLSRVGKLFSFTTVRVKPPHFIGEVPYLVGVVELPEGERIKTLLTGCDQSALEIGMEMELVIESVGKLKAPMGKIEAGTEVSGWKFRPLRKD